MDDGLRERPACDRADKGNLREQNWVSVTVMGPRSLHYKYVMVNLQHI